MPPKRRTTSGKKTIKSVKRSANSQDHNPHLPGYLMIAFGLLALSINFDMVQGLEWLKAYPLFAVLFGFVLIVKVLLSKK